MADDINDIERPTKAELPEIDPAVQAEIDKHPHDELPKDKDGKIITPCPAPFKYPETHPNGDENDQA